MRFGRHQMPPGKDAYYDDNGYPLLTLKALGRKGLLRSQTAFDDITVPPSRRHGVSSDEGWKILEPPPKAEAQSSHAPSLEPPQPGQLLAKGYIRGRSFIVPDRQPIREEQIGGVTKYTGGGYASEEAASFAERARRYREEQEENYGGENVVEHAGEPRTVRGGEVTGRLITYYVRLDTRIPGVSPEIQES